MIRLATENDLPAASALWEQMVLSMRPEWTPNRTLWESMAKTMLNSGLYSLLIAEKDNVIVGFIDGMIFTEPSTGKVHGVGQHFFILPEYRGRLGGELYRGMVSLALKKGAEVLEFFCFPEELSFWRRHGFGPARVMVRTYV